MPRPIILFAPELPDPITGGGLFILELTRTLSTWHRVTLVCPAFPHQADRVLQAKKTIAAFGGILMPLPVRPGRGTLLFALRRLMNRSPGIVFNLAHHEAQLTVSSLLAADPDMRVICVSPFPAALLPEEVLRNRTWLCLVNVEHHIIGPSGKSLWRQVDAKLERRKVARYELSSVRNAYRVGAISQQDARALRLFARRPDIPWVPPILQPSLKTARNPEPGKVLLTGNHTYHHTRIAVEWFLEQVWRQMDNTFELWITGRDTDGGRLAHLCRGFPNVHYFGLVPTEQLEALYARCSVAVNPTQSGSGVQMKLLEALRRGVPVVTSRRSNPFGETLACADAPEEWCERIQNACGQPTRFDYKAFFESASRSWKRWLES